VPNALLALLPAFCAESCPRSLARSAAIRARRALIPRCGFDAILHGKVFAFSILQNWPFAEFSNFVFNNLKSFKIRFPRICESRKRSRGDRRVICEIGRTKKIFSA
jgi:hypothetical protein